MEDGRWKGTREKRPVTFYVHHTKQGSDIGVDDDPDAKYP
jgi:hypothetical protein